MAEPITNVVCIDCLAVNRVPDSRRNDLPVCGRCKKTLLRNKPIELTDDNFQKFIAKSGLPVVVDFWAAWCGPCRMMAPAFADAAKELAPNIILAKLNTEEASKSAAPFNISGIPCLIAFKDGREFARQSGAMTAQQIVQWVKST